MPSPNPEVARLEQVELALDPERIVETIARLRRRIEERFPGSGLARVCGTLLAIGEKTKARLDWVDRPIVALRLTTWLVAALVVAGVVAAVRTLVIGEVPGGIDSAFDALQALETGLQDAVFIGLALVFLITVEGRIKRRRALGFIRELRALAHVVDMHQLTKDPDRAQGKAGDTASSPKRTLTKDQLGRYLDYCSEILSLASKVAALYAERFDDAVVLQAVDEVEAVTTGLSTKIWQKIVILDSTV